MQLVVDAAKIVKAFGFSCFVFSGTTGDEGHGVNLLSLGHLLQGIVEVAFASEHATLISMIIGYLKEGEGLFEYGESRFFLAESPGLITDTVQSNRLCRLRFQCAFKLQGLVEVVQSFRIIALAFVVETNGMER